MKLRGRSTAWLLISLAGVTPLAADWRDETGYTRLQFLAGPDLPAAPSQGFTQAEAFENLTNYLPDTANSLFSGKTFTAKSGGSGVSSHATSVATNLYGNSTSLVTGSCPVDLYSADGWLGTTFLKLASNNVPTIESRDVQNHSWISTGHSNSQATEADKRLDFAIDRDGFVCAVGANNSNTTVLPKLLMQSYHTISVGLVNGNHSAGFTTLDGTGRIKPDIVAPENFTSFATPMVASAAGLLHAELGAIPLTGADLPRVIKALLLATTTKETVASWSNTPTRPLDLRYGAGELNINHAYNALRAGRATASNVTLHHPRGWAAEMISGNSTKYYFFTVAAGTPSTPFCAALTWHRVVSKTGMNTWNASLANLNLKLLNSSSTIIAESLSSVDNVELVYQSALLPGTYSLVVENLSTATTAYGIAWHSLPAVTIAATISTAREINGQPGLVTVTRSGDTALPLFVPLVTSGNAWVGTDYQPLPASVTLPAGETSTVLQVIPVSDNLAEGNRDVSIAVAADFALVRDPAQTAVVTVLDKPFDLWRFTNFSPLELDQPSITSPDSDPDGDGLGNLIEYALSLDPKSPDASPLAISQPGGYLTLAATKNPTATDILWDAEVTGDLENWQPAVITTDTSGAFAAHDSIPQSNAGKRFIRLKIKRP